MALTQRGASYSHRNDIQDPAVKKALDDLASQVKAIQNQGNFGAQGTINPPPAPAQLSVTESGGIFTAVISQPNAPAGTRYRLQWSATYNFLSVIEDELAAT